MQLISVLYVSFVKGTRGQGVNKSQCGLKNNNSTVNALIDAINFTSSALDKNKFVMGIFVGLKKAFDTTNHTILNWNVIVCVVYRLTV